MSITNRSHNKKPSYTLSTILIVLTMFVISFSLRQLGYMRVRGESMLPTISNGEIIHVNKHFTENDITNNDIVLFTIDNGKHYIKRVVAKPGDIIEIENNKVSINGIVDEYYNAIESPSIEIKLKEDEYFVIGDNYNNSEDSRSFGPIRFDNIDGVAIEKYEK